MVRGIIKLWKICSKQQFYNKLIKKKTLNILAFDKRKINYINQSRKNGDTSKKKIHSSVVLDQQKIFLLKASIG